MALTKIDGELTSPDFAGQNIATTGSNTAGSFIPTSSTAPVNGVYLAAANKVGIATNSTGKIFIDSSGNVGIGADDPVANLCVRGDSGGNIYLQANNTSGDGGSSIFFKTTTSFSSTAGSHAVIEGNRVDSSNGYLRFSTRGSGTTAERMLIDSSGRLLVGTSSTLTDQPQRLQIEGTSFNTGGASLRRNSNDAGGTALRICKSRGTTSGSYSLVSSNDTLGIVQFCGADGTNDESAAEIRCEVDTTPGSNDMPGRLMFSTTADGASSPTERMRISSTGACSQIMPGHTLFTTLFGGSVTDNTSSGTATFDVTLTFADTNNYMIVEIFGYHNLYTGQQEYYRFMASHRTSSNIYRTDILDDLTSTGSIAQTNNTVTFTGRRPRSNVGTAVSSQIKVVCRSLKAPTSVTIADS